MYEKFANYYDWQAVVLPKTTTKDRDGNDVEVDFGRKFMMFDFANCKVHYWVFIPKF